MKYHILYNPLAGNNTGEEGTKKVEPLLRNHEVVLYDVTKIEDYEGLFAAIPENERIVVTGGDGTLNIFVNNVKNHKITHQIDYFAAGSGNDFMRDIGKKKYEYAANINKYITDLPSVFVNGEEHLFINGIGYGIDGYCCEVADKHRERKIDKQINYPLIAIKGLLGGYKPKNVVITVDGRRYKFKKVWMAPTMNGRYFGGGIMTAPFQDRLNPERKVTVVCMHSVGRLKCLLRFASLFEGKHVKYKEMCSVFEGHDIKVEFDKPCALQVDGGTILNVSSYQVKTAPEKERHAMG